MSPRTDIVTRAAPSRSPVQWNERLSRRIRTDALDTLGISSQTLAEQAIDAEHWEIAADLAEYFLDEMTRINDALFTWLSVILPFRARASGAPKGDEGRRIIDAMRDFGPGDGDISAVVDACHRRDAQTARSRLELMRVRVAAVHDHLVSWIQNLLTDLAQQYGDESVLDVVIETYEDLWKVRYSSWDEMSPEERLQISVEGMRGHLSGPGHRGDVGLIDDGDRFVMVLDPCGSCGVLRRGDPDSSRPSAQPAGTTAAHPWAWGRVGLGWYAVHSAIVMVWLQAREGKIPMRPLADCDQQTPCRWFIYKDLSDTRAEHYEQMGFSPPSRSTSSFPNDRSACASSIQETP